MSGTLYYTIDFPECLNRHKQMLVTSDDMNNSAFVINNLLQSLIRNASFRQNGRAMCVLLNQSYRNLSFIQMKCGHNLKALRDANQLRVIDVMAEFNQYFENKKFKFQVFAEHLLNQIDVMFYDRKHSNFSLLWFDDLSIFLSLGVTLKELHALVQRVRYVCKDNNVKLIIQTFRDEEQEDENLSRLILTLTANSSMRIHVNKLSSGYSKNVDGEIKIFDTIRNLNHRYLFKCHERLAKLTTSFS